MKRYLFISVALILLGCQEGQVDQVGMIPAMAQEAQNPVVNDSVFSESEPEPDSSYILFQMADEAMKKSELESNETHLKQEGEESIELVQGEVSLEKEVLQAETSDEELVSDEQEDVAPKKEELFAQVLEHVGKNGKVNYIGVKSQLEALDAFLLACSENEPSKEAPKNERLAFYINLYNAAVLKKVALNYPLKSINDLKDPWNDPFIQLSGKAISLSYLENEIIRKEFKEPKIHFALNCSAVSCPKLWNQTYSAANLDAELNSAMEDYLKQNGVGMAIENNMVQLSQIFEWYAVDFGGKENLVNWITQNSSWNLSGLELSGFITYKWGLNGN